MYLFTIRFKLTHLKRILKRFRERRTYVLSTSSNSFQKAFSRQHRMERTEGNLRFRGGVALDRTESPAAAWPACEPAATVDRHLPATLRG